MFIIAREDYTVFPRELVFSPFSGGGSIKHFPVRSRYDSSSEGSETFKLEASAEDWPFTQNTTTVTINECSTPTRMKHSIKIMVQFEDTDEIL